MGIPRELESLVKMGMGMGFNVRIDRRLCIHFELKNLRVSTG